MCANSAFALGLGILATLAGIPVADAASNNLFMGPITMLAIGSTAAGDALPPETKRRVNDAIDLGVRYLRRNQMATGAFGDGIAMRRAWPVGFAALPALALLECGVPRNDPAVQKAAALVRRLIAKEPRTYEVALAVLFLERLGDREDVPLIRSLALRLAAGQNSLGGWGYNCPILSPAQEKKLIEPLMERKGEESLTPLPILKKGASEPSDNSNTQFAILALWAARRHDLPLGFTFAKIEQRFRSTQRPDGWAYRIGPSQPYGSMTCVGLLGLATGRGAALSRVEHPVGERLTDEGIAHGLRALAGYLNDPSDSRLLSAGVEWWGPNGPINLYFLWSVERVGVLCSVKTIGGKDWYEWGTDLLLPTQKADGSWLGRGNAGARVIDTSMALLFLKRSDLLPDLRETLQKRLKITDPGLDGKGVTPKTSPGEKSDETQQSNHRAPRSRRRRPRDVHDAPLCQPAAPGAAMGQVGLTGSHRVRAARRERRRGNCRRASGSRPERGCRERRRPAHRPGRDGGCRTSVRPWRSSRRSGDREYPEHPARRACP